ncbi:hypothetical protein F4679DRAFT_576829 [Xylaria curta]|nr:hypothetical protein F4679DRAFT_576829 [Xylaria curta]
MDGLYTDIFGMLPSDDLSNNSALSQSTPDSYCTYPNKPAPSLKRKKKEILRRTFGSLDNRQGNDAESSGINKSALEFAVCKTRAAQSPLSLEKDDDSHRIALIQNSENEGEKLVEEPHVVDESGDCSCIYDRDGNISHRARYNADVWNEEDHSPRCYCCEGNYTLHPSQDDYDDDDDDIIEIEFRHILNLVKFYLVSATD